MASRYHGSFLSIATMVIMIISCVCIVGGRPSGLWVEYTNGDFHVEVNTEQPAYNLELVSTSSQSYSIVLLSLFEGTFDRETLLQNDVVDLTTLAWNFSTPIVDTDGSLVFNASNTLDGRWSSLTLTNHLSNTSGVTHLKFDVDIVDYQWVTSDVSRALVLAFQMTHAGANDSANAHTIEIDYPSGKQNGVLLDQAYFAAGPAFANVTVVGESSATTPVSLDYSNGTINLVYSHFPSSLSHDPTLGINSDTDAIDYSEPDPNDKLWIWVTVGSIGGLLVIGVIVGGIGLVLVHRRRQAAQYTTV